jgi:hypothetical protein
MRADLLEKIAGEHGLLDVLLQASVFKSLEADFLQFIPLYAIWNVAGSAVQSLDPQLSPFDNPSEFRAKFRWTVFTQALFSFFSGKPAGVSIRFLGWFEPGYFAKVGIDGKLWLRRPGGRCRVRLATEVSGEGNSLHTAVNTSLFKSLERGGLRMRETGFNAALGENPTPAAGLNQQELDAAFAHAVTNGGHLLAAFRKP